MNITELSWQARAEKLEAELQKAAALINTSRNEAAVSSVTCGQMRKELERVQLERDHYKNKVERYREVLGVNTNESICEAAERVQAASARMRESLEKIAAFTNPDDENSYRADDREGCLDTVYSTAKSALANDAGTGYVRKEDVVPLVEFAQSVARSMPADSNIHRRAKEAIAHAKAKGLTE